jgi:hypothetical protein
MTALSTPELRTLVAILDKELTQPSTQRQALLALQDKLVRMIAESAGSPTWRTDRSFVLELPLELAPTMNAYASMEGWHQAKLRKMIDIHIVAQFAKWPAARLKGVARVRLVRGTRLSSRRVDEESLDACGFKLAVDRLVRGGVLAGDMAKHIHREARWIYAKPGAGRALVEVFDAIGTP